MSASGPDPAAVSLPASPAPLVDNTPSNHEEDTPDSPHTSTSSPTETPPDSPTSEASYSISSVDSDGRNPHRLVTDPTGIPFILILIDLPNIPHGQSLHGDLGFNLGLEVKKLYLVCMCGFPGCTNLLWSSDPDAESEWPKHPDMDGYDSDEDDVDPETTKYGILLRHCGRPNFWHVREIVIQSRYMMEMVETAMSIGYEDVEEFWDTLEIDPETEGWVFRAPFEELFDVYDRFVDLLEDDHEWADAASVMLDVLTPIMDGTTEMAQFL